jgi:hypothetical protein
MTRPRLLAVVAALLGLLLLGACGIPAEDEPRPLPTGSATNQPPPPTTEPTPAEDQAQLWFVREGLLVPVLRAVAEPPGSQDLIDLLVAGPTAEEEEAGIRTAVVSVVTGEPLVVTAISAGVEAPPLQDDQEAIVLSEEFTDLNAEEQVLVLGEVVTTVAVGDVAEILFVDGTGKPLGVPVADGRLRNGPVSPADYASLIA